MRFFGRRWYPLLEELQGEGGEGGGGGSPTEFTEAKLKALINSEVKAALAHKQRSQDGGEPPPAPAVHTAKSREVLAEDLSAIIKDTIGSAFADAVKVSKEAAAEAMGRSLKEPFELTADERLAAERGNKAERGQSGMKVASYMGWLARANGDPERAHKFAKAYGKADPVVVRALGESQMSTGGAIVPVDIATDFIELLRKESVFLQAQPNQLVLNHGNMLIPKITGGATPTWVGESVNGTLAQQSFGQVAISLKKLMVLSVSSNELLQDASPWADQMIRDDLASGAAETLDSTLLRGTGTSFQPRGLRNWAASGTTFAASGTVNVANVTLDSVKAIRQARDRRIKLRRPAWFMSPRSWGYLMAARDGNNNLVWAAELAQGRFFTYPVFITQNIPDTLGAGGDSEIIFADMSEVLYATDGQGMAIDARDGAAYHDGTTVQSAYSKDETVFRLRMRCDLVVRQSGNEIGVLTGVTQA